MARKKTASARRSVREPAHTPPTQQDPRGRKGGAAPVADSTRLPRKSGPPDAVQPRGRDRPSRGQSFPIVGVGASAGGLDSFTQLLKNLPDDTGMAFVLVQHLDPKHESQLTTLLSQATRMPVTQATRDLRVEADHVYVIPPNRDLHIANGVLHPVPRAEIAGQHMPIDSFLHSLAQDQGNRALGIILSGTASDGTSGLKAIKAEGGITFAQEARSAKFEGMPRSAIAAGVVDFVLPPEGIARQLVKIGRHPLVTFPSENAGESVAEVETATVDDLNRIFVLVRRATGVDFTYYKHSTVWRRIQRRMVLLAMETVGDYVERLQDNPAEVEALYHDLLINVTAFFREPKMFQALKDKILPQILKSRAPGDPVRIWVPGCATGEEAYSLAIYLTEFLEDTASNASVQVFATDVSETAIERARAGRYTEDGVQSISPERRQRFFIKTNGVYQISKSIRAMCVFARQNVIRDPPFSKLDLISCCNVLIYLEPVLQRKVISIFHYALKPEGFLVLGTSETVGAFSDLFLPVDQKLKIYSKKVTVKYDLRANDYAERRLEIPERRGASLSLGLDAQKEIDRIVLAESGPADVLIDEQMRVIQIRGHTGPYLELAPGGPSGNLLKMAKEGLRVRLRTAIHRAKRENVLAREEGLRVDNNGQSSEVNFKVIPIKNPVPAGKRYFLVLFENTIPLPIPESKRRAGPRAKSARRDARVRIQLQEELASAKKYLQAIIEEREATNEELRSANEEAQASNEELETAKEEIQSTNEELTTLNEEVKNRNFELSQINTDLSNLLESVTMPILMVGRDLCIRRFTPQAERMLNLIAADVGRPVSHLKPNIEVPDLERLLLDVMDRGSRQQREIQDAEGRWYSLRVLPYHGPENKIDGAVMVMVDIDASKRGRDYAEAIVETVREPLVILNRDLQVEQANRAFYQTFQISPDATENRLLYELGNGQWNIPRLRTLLEDIVSQNSEFHDFEVEHEFERLGRRSMLLNARRVYGHDNRRPMILLAIEDITERQHAARAEEALRRSEEQLRHLQKMEAVGRLAGGVAHDFNNQLTVIMGFADVLLRRLASDDPARKHIEEIHRAGERARSTTSQLLSFSRRQVLQPKVLDLNAVVTQVSEMLRRLIGEHIELVVVACATLDRVKADPGQIEQIIVNLVLNARDAMSMGGKLTIETANVDVDDATARLCGVAPGRYVALTVRDTGIGMDEQTQSHIFEPFFTTKNQGLGTGLGLATVFGIVEQSGGHIRFHSESGRGATFQIYLPRVEEAVEAASPGAGLTEAPKGSEIVLLVEDEDMVRALARMILQENGYTVLECSKGDEALAISEHHQGPIHLMITDVVMPMMSGRELAERLAPLRPDTRVLYMSGYSDDAIVHYGVLEPGIAFLQKPFTRDTLIRKAREVLDVPCKGRVAAAGARQSG